VDGYSLLLDEKHSIAKNNKTVFGVDLIFYIIKKESSGGNYRKYIIVELHEEVSNTNTKNFCLCVQEVIFFT